MTDMETTRDRIIRAAIELVDEAGYKGATTRKIAERADVNEVTLFRHFGSKKGVLDAAVDKYSFSEMLDHSMTHDISWDLEEDLPMLSRKYQEIVASKRQVILISLREEGRFPELDEAIAKLPVRYRESIADYFRDMIKRGEMAHVDAETAATNFLLLNFGYFFLKERLAVDEDVIPIERFVGSHIDMFINGLK